MKQLKKITLKQWILPLILGAVSQTYTYGPMVNFKTLVDSARPQYLWQGLSKPPILMSPYQLFAQKSIQLVKQNPLAVAACAIAACCCAYYYINQALLSNALQPSNYHVLQPTISKNEFVPVTPSAEQKRKAAQASENQAIQQTPIAQQVVPQTAASAQDTQMVRYSAEQKHNAENSELDQMVTDLRGLTREWYQIQRGLRHFDRVLGPSPIKPQLVHPSPERILKPLPEKIELAQQDQKHAHERQTIYHQGRHYLKEICNGQAHTITVARSEAAQAILYFLDELARQQEKDERGLMPEYDNLVFKLMGSPEKITHVMNYLTQDLPQEKPNVYKRRSTHYPELNDARSETNHFGLDIRRIFCKSDMATLLFAQLTPNSLFLKPEYRGTHEAKDLVEHALGVCRMLMQNHAPKEALELTGIPPADAPDTRREKMPHWIVYGEYGLRPGLSKIVYGQNDQNYCVLSLTNRFLALQHNEKVRANFEEQINNAIKFGICQIIPLLKSMADSCQNSDQSLAHDIQQFIVRIEQKYPFWKAEQRKGNEIVFDLDMLTHAPDFTINLENQQK